MLWSLSMRLPSIELFWPLHNQTQNTRQNQMVYQTCYHHLTLAQFPTVNAATFQESSNLHHQKSFLQPNLLSKSKKSEPLLLSAQSNTLNTPVIKVISSDKDDKMVVLKEDSDSKNWTTTVTSKIESMFEPFGPFNKQLKNQDTSCIDVKCTEKLLIGPTMWFHNYVNQIIFHGDMLNQIW